MSYYPDLSPYEYTPYDIEAGISSLNIGWLAASEPYNQGVTSVEFQEKLLQFCAKDCVYHCLGYDDCEFCENHDSVIRVHCDGEEVWLGNGEIRVIGDSATYAAPTLIYHYVVAHNYRPPDEFIEAVLTGPLPGSRVHQALIKKLI